MPQVNDSVKVGVIHRSMKGGRRDTEHPSRMKENEFYSATNIEIRNCGLFKTRRGSEKRATGGSGIIQGKGFFEKSPGNAFNLKVQGGVPYYWANAGNAWLQIGTATFQNTTSPISIVPGVISGVSGYVAIFFVGNGEKVAYWDGDTSTSVVQLGNTSTDAPDGDFAITLPCGRVAVIGDDNFRDHVLFSGLFDQSNGQWDSSSLVKRIFTPHGEPVKAIASYRKNEMIAWTDNTTHLLGSLNESAASSFTRNTLDERIGIKARKSAVVVGEHAFFMSQDGHIRTVIRTQLDVAFGISQPITQHNNVLVGRINLREAHKSTATVFDNYLLVAVPIDSAQNNNTVIVFDLLNPVQLDNGLVAPICLGEWTGWNVFDWIIAQYDNQQRLFWIDNATGDLYEGLVVESDSGNPITSVVELPGIDFGLSDQEKTLRDGWINYETSVGTILIEVRDERMGYSTVETITIDGDDPVLPVALNFALGNRFTDEEPFYFFGYGRSRWWQTRLTLSAGVHNIREITHNGFVENEKAGVW